MNPFVKNSMDGACKNIQGSSELIFQPVKTSIATGDLEIFTLAKLPIGLSISPKEFHILRNIDYNITCQQNGTTKHRK